jgi:hypothetical protein
MFHCILKRGGRPHSPPHDFNHSLSRDLFCVEICFGLLVELSFTKMVETGHYCEKRHEEQHYTLSTAVPDPSLLVNAKVAA